jgi:TolB protein
VKRFGIAVAVALGLLVQPNLAVAQQPAPDESVLGEIVVTGTVQEHVPKIAVLPSLSAAQEDVIVRGVVRNDLELTGLFEVIPDNKAPPGLYDFEDPVDIEAWKKLGAESVVKVAARPHKPSGIEVLGIAYFTSHGKDPVYESRLTVESSEARVTAHRITDALLGALTGRPGSFASHFTFAGDWVINRRVFSMDSDGHALQPITEATLTAISPAWGPGGKLFYSASVDYSPFRLTVYDGQKHERLKLPFSGSIYGIAFNRDQTKLALAVAEDGGHSSIYVGKPDGTELKRASSTELSTHPVFSPSGKLAWIGGKAGQPQRLWVDGKSISPSGFTAAAPTFCDTEDGIRVVYAVVVGDKQDLVMSTESGGGIQRLSQNQGSNSYPACSPDGRMLAFFSTRGKKKGMYVMSLIRWTSRKLADQYGYSLRWDALPPAKRR